VNDWLTHQLRKYLDVVLLLKVLFDGTHDILLKHLALGCDRVYLLLIDLIGYLVNKKTYLDRVVLRDEWVGSRFFDILAAIVVVDDLIHLKDRHNFKVLMQ
jgi:hypothetical protein